MSERESLAIFFGIERKMVHVNKSKINYDGIPFWKIVTNIKKKRDGCIYGFYLDFIWIMAAVLGLFLLVVLIFIGLKKHKKAKLQDGRRRV